jgi:endonuclease YncB( thermonuclease family)
VISRELMIAACVLAAGTAATPAAADPCTAAVPTRAGHSFSGQVRYVGDGDSLCVGDSPDPTTWIEVRLADFDAPELHAAFGARAKASLEDVALGRGGFWTAVRGRNGRVQVYDRVIAVCRINGQSIGTLLRQVGAPQGGR